jgi:hypothetical protein
MKKKNKAKKEFDVKRFLVANLRASYRKTPMYNQALRLAKREYFETSSVSGKKLRRVHFECAKCGRCFSFLLWK